MSPDETHSKEVQQVEGEVVCERFIEYQPDDFSRAVLNQFQYRGLRGGRYKLVRVSDE